MDAEQHVVSRLLNELKAGNSEAFAELLPLVYGELHHIAGRHRQRWVGEETLDTTALLHEAYLRLVHQSAHQWESRAHFFAVASRAMRQILLDYAKRKRAARRGGGHVHFSLDEVAAALEDPRASGDARSTAVIALDESLKRLETHNPMQSRIVECRFFGGMTIKDTAAALGISPATVSRGWLVAKTWLYHDLRKVLDETG